MSAPEGKELEVVKECFAHYFREFQSQHDLLGAECFNFGAAVVVDAIVATYDRRQRPALEDVQGYIYTPEGRNHVTAVPPKREAFYRRFRDRLLGTFDRWRTYPIWTYPSPLKPEDDIAASHLERDQMISDELRNIVHWIEAVRERQQWAVDRLEADYPGFMEQLLATGTEAKSRSLRASAR